MLPIKNFRFFKLAEGKHAESDTIFQYEIRIEIASVHQVIIYREWDLHASFLNPRKMFPPPQIILESPMVLNRVVITVLR